MGETSHKKHLNDKQAQILKLMYKFRFVTSELLARYKNVSTASVNNSLALLLELGYVRRYYDTSYKLQGKAARYYLAPKGIDYVRDALGLTGSVLQMLRRQSKRGEPFINHNLDVFAVFLALRDAAPDAFHIFSKIELNSFTQFPYQRPDLSMRRIKPSKSKPNDYMVEVATDKPLHFIKRRFDDLLRHYESGRWEAKAGTSYPVLMLVCSDGQIEAGLKSYAKERLDNRGIDDLIVYTASFEVLTSSRQHTHPTEFGTLFHKV